MRVRIQPYGASRSARKLCNALNDLGELGRVVRLKRAGQSSYVPREDDIVINWGSQTERFDERHYINQPRLIHYASDKTMAFRLMQGKAIIPDFTAYKWDAEEWQRQGHTVYARTTVTGHSGRGIVICKPDDVLPDAPLYTKQVIAEDEYRMHVCKMGDEYQVFDQQQKKRKNGVESNEEIRNHSNGWIFARRELRVPDKVKTEAINALAAMGLDFGGVDVAYNRELDVATVYEVNTACGIEGSSLARYARMFCDMIERRNDHAG